jgi:TolB-like protein/lipopolysaccharide biosynthesis regulator YciM/predicted negative regulator of RcsB-dependent stress response
MNKYILAFVLILCAGAVHADALQSPQRAEAAPKTVAVLDFRNVGPSVELEPLRKALARMLTTDLSAYGQIEVVARERVDRMITETQLGESGLVDGQTAQRAGRAMDADYLVQGAFAGSADRIRVHGEVFDVAAGQVIGTADQSGKADDVIEVEGKLLNAVTAALKLDKPSTRAKTQSSGKSQTLAILYLQNLSPDAKLDPMEIGFTDTLITYLQDRTGISVVEREQLDKVLDELGLERSALAENGQSAKIGQMLGAQVLVLGSYLVARNSIRFDVHLVAADTGVLLHAVTAHGPTDDPDGPLRSLADKVADSLTAMRPTSKADETHDKTSAESRLHYSRAVAFEKKQRFEEARDEFERCVYLDPRNLEARARLGKLCSGETAVKWLEPIVLTERDYLERFGNTLAFAYESCGKPELGLTVLKRMFDDANLPGDQRVDIALQIARGCEGQNLYFETEHWYKEALQTTGSIDLTGTEWEQAYGTYSCLIRRASIRQYLACLYDKHGDLKRAIAQNEDMLTEVPRGDEGEFSRFTDDSIVYLGKRYEEQRDYKRAEMTVRQAVSRFANTGQASLAKYWLARVAAITGHDREAVGLFESSAQDSPEMRNAPEALLDAAALLNRIGDRKRASELVRRVALSYGTRDKDESYGPNVGLLRALPAASDSEHVLPVLLDESGDQSDSNSSLLALRSMLIRAGDWVHVNRGPISQHLLAGYSILIISPNFWYGNYTQEEVESIRNFVAGGGGLLVFLSGSDRAHGTNYLRCGPLMSAFGAGIVRSVTPIDRGQTDVCTVIGIGRTPRVTGAGKVIEPHNYPVEIPVKLPFGAVIAKCGEIPAVAAFHYGLGRVILSGSSNDDVYDEELTGLFACGEALSKAPYLNAVVGWLHGEQDHTRDGLETAMRKVAIGDESSAARVLGKIASDGSVKPSAEEARLLLAYLLKEDGNLQTAAPEFQDLAASAKNPEVRALATLNAARIHAASGGQGIERALDECWKIWKDDQSNPWAAPALIEGGQWAYKAGDMVMAQQAFDTVMNAGEPSADKLKAMLWSALCREKRRDTAGAIRIYNAIEAEYPSYSFRIPAEGLTDDIRCYAHQRALELKP